MIKGASMANVRKQILSIVPTVHNNEVCVLSGCPYSGVFQQVQSSQKKKQRNQTIEFSWGLYSLVVLFLLVYVICASIPTEGTGKQSMTVLQKLCISQFHLRPRELAFFCLGWQIPGDGDS